MREYPEDYRGPKAGQSTNEEWIAVRDYDAFKYVRDGTWSYSDFDCYLYAMCEEYYKKGKCLDEEANNKIDKALENIS